MSVLFIVIKVGGVLFDDVVVMMCLFLSVKDVQVICLVVVVYGGGFLVEILMVSFGFKSIKIDGFWVIFDEYMFYICGVLVGFVNKQLCVVVFVLGLMFVGLFLFDGNMVVCELFVD